MLLQVFGAIASALVNGPHIYLLLVSPLHHCVRENDMDSSSKKSLVSIYWYDTLCFVGKCKILSWHRSRWSLSSCCSCGFQFITKGHKRYYCSLSFCPARRCFCDHECLGYDLSLYYSKFIWSPVAQDYTMHHLTQTSSPSLYRRIARSYSAYY